MPRNTNPGYSFGSAPLDETDRSVRLVDTNPSVANVRNRFHLIRAQGEYLAAHDNDLIPGVRYTRGAGKDTRAKVHFQGIQRLRRGRYLVVSGGDVREPASHIFVVKMGSRRAKGTWGSNLTRSREPSARDGIVRVVALAKKHWHAGGISVLGDILAVPIENGNSSRIVFLHMADPENPTRFPKSVEIVRPNRKATAVALTKLANGRFICAVKWGKKSVDFYVSNTDDFFDGFGSRVPASLDENREYQSINFVLQEHRGSQRLFMVGTENSSIAAPTLPGRDKAGLFSVDLPGGLFDDGRRRGAPTITFVDERKFQSSDQHCNMDAAAGLYVDRLGAMHLYGAYHWRIEYMIRMTEFRGEFSPLEIDDPAQAYVELFEHKNYDGKRLSVLGGPGRDTRIADYTRIFVRGDNFDNRVSSVRWQIPSGFTYRLYRDEGFSGDAFDLAGTGREEKIRDLGKNDFADLVTSSRYVG